MGWCLHKRVNDSRRDHLIKVKIPSAKTNPEELALWIVDAGQQNGRIQRDLFHTLASNIWICGVRLRLRSLKSTEISFHFRSALGSPKLGVIADWTW